MNPDPQELSSIADIASDNADFSFLVAALAKANPASTLMMDGAYTVFAPTNDAFAAFLESNDLAFEDLTAEALAPILQYHVVGAKVISAELETGYVNTIYNAMEGKPVSLFVELDGGVMLNGSVSVTTPDIETSNGVIHMIDRVLNPTSVVDIAINNSTLSKLVEAVVKAGLVDVLSADGPYTVFAPTDAAFAQLFADLGVSGIEEIPAETLVPILQYHVVAGNVLSKDLSEGDVTTLNGNIKISLAGPVTINDDAEVLATDIQGTQRCGSCDQQGTVAKLVIRYITQKEGVSKGTLSF